MTRQQRRAAARAADKTRDVVAEVVIYDATAEALKELFLPPDGSRVSARDLEDACGRLAEATRAVKALGRSV